MEVIFTLGKSCLVKWWVQVHEWSGLGEGAGNVRPGNTDSFLEVL